MPGWDFERSISSLRLQADLGLDHGLPLHRLLAGTGVSEDELRNPHAMIQAHQELRLIRNLVASLATSPALGIEAGRRYHFTAFGALGFAMVSSRSVRDALDIALQYFHLTFAFTRFRVRDSSQHTIVSIDDSELPEELQCYMVERDAAALITVQRDLFPTQPMLQSLSLRYAEPAWADQYQSFYGLHPAFDAAHNQVILDRALMLQRMPQANELARQAAEEQCRQLLDKRSQRSGLAARVRDAIAARIADSPAMDDIAANMHMVPRTLHRRLKAEDTSFAELRDEVRQTLAEEYLTGPRLSVEKIAERLGYAEASSFINAYKRWHGRTPYADKRAGRT